MEYKIIKDLKKIKVNILIHGMCNISQLCKLLLNDLKDKEIQPSIIAKVANTITRNNMYKMEK